MQQQPKTIAENDVDGIDLANKKRHSIIATNQDSLNNVRYEPSEKSIYIRMDISLFNWCYFNRFSVFALGSSAYKTFCAFGKDVDELLAILGGQRLMEVTCGDELDGQEQSFTSWSQQIFQVIIE